MAVVRGRERPVSAAHHDAPVAGGAGVEVRARGFPDEAPVARFDGWGEDRCLIWETARPDFGRRHHRRRARREGGADRPFATAHNRHRLLTRQTARLEDRFTSSSPPFHATSTGAGAAPSGRPGTACHTSAACGSFRTAISRSATEGTGSRSAGSRRICLLIGSCSGRIGMRSCLGLRGRRAGGRAGGRVGGWAGGRVGGWAGAGERVGGAKITIARHPECSEGDTIPVMSPSQPSG